MLDGRVKTIHPRITAGILAIRSKPDHMRAIAEHGIPRIDLVAVSLYEFDKVAAKKDASLEELIENIDIGGPTMIRAAAKNWQDVAVITSPAEYAGVIAELPREVERFQKERIGSWPRRRSPPPPRMIAQSPLDWPRSLPRANLCRIRSTSSLRALWRCAMAKTRTRPLRSILQDVPVSPEQNNFTARSFPTTTWWTWMRRGN